MKTNKNTIELGIEKIVPNGFGMGFSDGLTVFVPFAAVGDLVRVRITKKKKKIAFAEMVEILEASPTRTQPACSYYGVCGGCDFQHLEYSAQLDAKVSIIEDCLRRIGTINEPPIIEMIPSPREFGYRARTRWQINVQRNRIGYFGRGSNTVVDIDRCPILTDTLQKQLTTLRKDIGSSKLTGANSLIEAADNNDGDVSVYTPGVIDITDELTFTAAGETYFYNAKSFFQGNLSLIDDLIRQATVDINGETALDLYCGVGLFSLPLARSFAQVVGVENDSGAVKFAEKAAGHAYLENLTFHAEPVEKFLARNKKQKYDFVLLDPPRTGAELSVIKSIAALKPKKITYVSCEPSILARDLNVFLDYGYQIETIIALDLFPQTYHVETVVRLLSNTGITNQI